MAKNSMDAYGALVLGHGVLPGNQGADHTTDRKVCVRCGMEGHRSHACTQFKRGLS